MGYRYLYVKWQISSLPKAGPMQISRDQTSPAYLCRVNVPWKRDVESVVAISNNNWEKQLKLPAGYYIYVGANIKLTGSQGTFDDCFAYSIITHLLATLFCTEIV